MSTVSRHLARTVEQLSQCQVSEAQIEAEVLLRHVLGMERAELFVSWDRDLDPDQEERLGVVVQSRSNGEPLAYIVGHREFYGLDFAVTPDVLIPRQETELLVDLVLEIDESRGSGDIGIVDVGTGSGAIAVALAYNMPRVRIYATDVCSEALKVADLNRRTHGVAERVHLRRGDLLEALDAPVDVIVSNPPYIQTEDIARLAAEIRREPCKALDGGVDGLDVIRRLLRQAPDHLRPGGHLVIEIAPEQVERVCLMARDAMPMAVVSWARDLMGLPRVVVVGAGGGVVEYRELEGYSSPSW